MGFADKKEGSMSASEKVIVLTTKCRNGELSQADLLYEVEMMNRT